MKSAISCALAIAAVAAAAPAAPAIAQTGLDVRRPASRDGTVKIASTVGSVRVVGWNRDSVSVSGTLGAGSDRLSFDTNERETRIRVVLERGVSDVAESHLEVSVPRGSSVAIRTASAGIEVENVNGTLDLESVSGAIRVRGSARVVYAQSATGDVDLDVRTKVIRAKSVDGSVTVRGALGFIEVSTVSGSALLVGSRVWEGEVTSVSGDIRFEGDFEQEGSFYFESHSGTIELLLPTGVRADFDVTSVGGATVENEFASSRARAFSIGGGGTQVKVKSFKGKVKIRKA